MNAALRRLVLEVVGWVLLLAGIAALVLPGPGLLLTFFGLAVLSRQYAWARRWVEPVRLRALQGAAEGVQSWPKIALSCVGAVSLAAVGVVWIVGPQVPSWWPAKESWWLPGGAWTGATLILSGVAAFALIGYSYRRFRGNPAALADLDRQVDEADEERHHHDG
ncbi:PGPGW domain-containing protein [Nocardioides montaniterrae]